MTIPIPTESRARNAGLVRGLYDVLYRRHRPDEAGRLFHDAHVDHDPRVGPGPSGPLRHWESMRAAFPGLRARIGRLVADEDRVMLFAAWTGRTPAGDPFELHTAELYRIAEGRIAEHWNVTDRDVLAGHVPDVPDALVGPEPAVLHGLHSEDERANAAVVLDAYRVVFSEHRLDLADRYYHRDYRHHNARTDRVPDGLEAFTAFFADNLAAFPDLAVTVEHVVAAGDRVMVFVTWTGTLTGAWSGGGPSGLPLVMRTCDHFRLEDGKVSEHWEVVDYLPVRRAGLPTP
ncbi:ester cyclase family protein [Streptomyces anulatus]|uniref:ester cyclase family protein n=1 Tax=Streptomyces anulatus TaxID=1892 RepID=UPI00364CAADD